MPDFDYQWKNLLGKEVLEDEGFSEIKLRMIKQNINMNGILNKT